jgi:hypothetical protein
VNLWMKRAIGVAALGGGLLAFSAGGASAQETSADASAEIGRATSAQVSVCSDGRVLSRLLGSCSQDGSSGNVQASRGSDRSAGIQARARVPRVASADVSVGAGRNRPRTTASGHAAMTQRAEAGADAAADTSPRGQTSATADLSRSGRLLTVDSLASLAGVGLLGSSPFTLTGDPAADNLLPSGSLTPAGIGVLGSGPIGSGNQAGATGTSGTPGQTGTTGTSGTPGQTGTTGLTPGTGGDPAGTIPAFAPLRPLVSAGRALASTGAASDLLVMMAVALLAAGALFLRAARPAAVREGGDR